MSTTPTPWSVQAVRSRFLKFFEEKGHEIVPSAPIVLKGDPTLMFTNAGMNQFKDRFLGHSTQGSVRIADSQKCLRVSGKHNDLEQVGHDTYHHTMFEMLGNWSFGDYFKQEAIAWAWELLTEVYHLDKDRLYITVFAGDYDDELPVDEDARQEWLKWVKEDRILTGSKKDNFWEMGATGPCGPSSEIHIDLRSEAERQSKSGHLLVNKDHPLVVEIWNLVFIEFNRLEDGTLQKLPTRHVDTGMGLERLCMALQGVYSNYDTDVFTPLLRQIEQLSGKIYGKDRTSDVAMRVIADHVRAVAFAIADGQLPSNSGAGYVIRRILRRAIRYAYSFLGMRESFIHKLAAVLQEQMQSSFPEIATQQKLVQRVIKEEEESFLRTLEQGLDRLNQLIFQAVDKKIEGAQVFELYDTYGFPPDLTALILREKGLFFRQTEFDQEMEAQKARARGATKTDTGDWQILREDQKEEFIGYDYTRSDVKITRFRKISQNDQTRYQLVFNLTPFYPEGGGQVGDTGIIENEHESITIGNTVKEHGLILHICEKLPENPMASFKAKVSREHRFAAAENHSATHLLHQALREILGPHVEQKGSLVNAQYLRFDFSHFSKLTEAEIEQVEDRVNELVRKNYELEEFRNLPMTEAKNMGALALFGEKYGDTVRVIKFGKSIELCGGTHVRATGEIGFFTITQETAVASGIRRIEACSGQAARSYFKEKMSLISRLESLFKNPKDLLLAVEKLKEENQQLKKEIKAFQEEQAGNYKVQLLEKVEQREGYQLLIARCDLPGAELKNLLFQLKNEVPQLAAVLASAADEAKPQLGVIFDESVAQRKSWHAGKLVKGWASAIKGGGGGQPFFAMAGGSDASGLEAALQQAQADLN